MTKVLAAITSLPCYLINYIGFKNVFFLFLLIERVISFA